MLSRTKGQKRSERLGQFINHISIRTCDLSACSALPQKNTAPPAPLLYQNDMIYRKQVGNTLEGQRLYTEILFESVNHATVKVKVNILYVTPYIIHNKISIIYQGQTLPTYIFKYSIYNPQNINSYIIDVCRLSLTQYLSVADNARDAVLLHVSASS